MHRVRSLATLLAFTALIGLPTAASAQLLVNQNNLWTQYPFGYGNSANTVFSSMLNTAFGGAGNITTQSIALSGTAPFSALLLDLRGTTSSDPPLTAGEVAELSAFVASGQRVIAFGDYQIPNVVNSFLAPFGGGFGAPLLPTPAANPAIGGALTAGVGTVQAAGGASIVGGTQVFNVPFVSLFGPSQNFLAINDTNICANNWINNANNSAFCSNAATWLASSPGPTQSVPEPAGLLLIATGALALVIVRRRRDVFAA